METIRTIRDTHTAQDGHLDFHTQLLSSEHSVRSVLLYVHRDRQDYLGWGAQDVHLDFHTAPEFL